MKCKYDSNIECDFEKIEDVRGDCRSFNCESYEKARFLSNETKESLYEHIETIEDERNKLLNLCNFILDNREDMMIPNTMFLDGYCIDTWLKRLTGRIISCIE